jgi:Ca2+-binding RTX toxin-like protein
MRAESKRPRRARGGLITLVTLGLLGSLGTGGAMASTLAGSATNPVYTAVAGETNDLTVTEQANGVTVWDDSVAITAVPADCVLNAGNAVCTPAGQVLGIATISLGDQNDSTTFASFSGSIIQNGEAGNDTLRSGSAFTQSTGGAGDDTLTGSDSANPNASTAMAGGTGADTFVGSVGDDSIDYSGATAVTVTPDGIANDGVPGENDNVGAGIHGIIGSDGDDSITGGPVDSRITGGLGNDTIAGGAGDDSIDPGSGNDLVDGGNGDDFFTASLGNDDTHGGEGLDTIGVFSPGVAPAFTPADLTVTLDDVANDGAAGETKNIHSDIEDIASSGGNDTIVGTAASQIISAAAGNDTIDAGAGNDLVFGDDGDDTINARDGFADRIQCGAGTDVVNADTLDIASSSCEAVIRVDVGNANEDKAPTVSITTPAAGARLRGGPVTVNIAANDDKGVARVVLFSGSKQVGSDATAPYQITYQPTGADIGKNTLIALAIDTSEQSATAVRDVTIGKFTPRSVSLSVTPSRDRAAPFAFAARGTVLRPPGVSAAQGCRSGSVRVDVTRGGRRVARRTVKLTRGCTYTARFGVRGTGRLTFRARFNGNSVLNARSSSRRTTRAG